ncbi:MAG: UTP--glucose-1-phosphate uridylyltransferase [Spirochaetota bacterium]
MISYTGYEQIIDAVYKNKQEQVFHYWDQLNSNDKQNLILELNDVDFDLMNKLYAQKSALSVGNVDFEPAPYIPLFGGGTDADSFIKAVKKGMEYISHGRTAVLLVAGGQGTRLGFDGPKGMLPISPVKNKSLFQIHAEKLLFYSKKYKIAMPWLIMTSKENHSDTVGYFKNNKYFGLNPENVFFFSQKMIPSLDLSGKLLLKTQSSLCLNPDGHGGTLTALSSSGILDELSRRKIDVISYFQIDNPLVNIVDPLFIGFHVLNGSDVSSKGVMKTDPGEKVGVFVKFNNGKTGIVEYSDLPQGKQTETDNNGNLKFCMGSIAIHVFNTKYIESIISGSISSLQYHTAQKKIKALVNGKDKDVDSLKYEKFIFDTLSLTDKNTILETRREEEFAPVKNANGVDSPDTAKKLMSNLHRKWLIEKKITIPENVKVIEISPLLAVEAGDLPKNLTLPETEKVYLE